MSTKRKDTVYRPSQSHMKYVRRSDGKQVVNLAYKETNNNTTTRDTNVKSDFNNQQDESYHMIEQGVETYDNMIHGIGTAYEVGKSEGVGKLKEALELYDITPRDLSRVQVNDMTSTLDDMVSVGDLGNYEYNEIRGIMAQAYRAGL